jgi:hypothetical protein
MLQMTTSFAALVYPHRVNSFVLADFAIFAPFLHAMTLFRGGLLNADASWVELLKDDITWMWHQLKGASSLLDPALRVMALFAPLPQAILEAFGSKSV